MTLPQALSTRYAHLSDFDAQIGSPRAWLTAPESRELAHLKHPLRRREWLAGRWQAKQMVLGALARAFGAAGRIGLADVELLTRNPHGSGVRPQIRVAGRALHWSVSISHSERGLLVALATDPQSTVGVDLTELGDDGASVFSEAFGRLWFSADERRWAQADSPRRFPTLWALKEAVYKACNVGESWAPRQIEVIPLAAGNFQCVYRGIPLEPLSLSVRELDGQIAVVVQVARHSTLSTGNAERYPAACRIGTLPVETSASLE